ncbi:MAG: hypothetical protein ACYCO0_04880, partial [Candidatus Micrarchaeaceae archaeon]
NCVDIMVTKAREVPAVQSRETVTVNGQKYAILRLEGHGLTLAQAIRLAKAEGKEMLTLDEAREIRDSKESNAAFRMVLKPGDWTYVRDKKSELRSLAACLDCYGAKPWTNLLAYGDLGSEGSSRVLILKEARSKPTMVTSESSGMSNPAEESKKTIKELQQQTRDFVEVFGPASRE